MVQVGEGWREVRADVPGCIGAEICTYMPACLPTCVRTGKGACLCAFLPLEMHARARAHPHALRWEVYGWPNNAIMFTRPGDPVFLGLLATMAHKCLELDAR